jgi:hypothetical protein
MPFGQVSLLGGRGQGAGLVFFLKDTRYEFVEAQFEAT